MSWLIIIEFLVECLIYIFFDLFFTKILAPILKFIGTLYLKALNLTLKNKINIDKSPNKTFIGFLIFIIIGVALVAYFVYD